MVRQTPACFFYPWGKCVNGSNCRFRHDEVLPNAVTPAPSTSESSSAPPWRTRRKPSDSELLRDFDKLRLRPEVPIFVPKNVPSSVPKDSRAEIPCRFYALGCKKGNLCPFAHIEANKGKQMTIVTPVDEGNESSPTCSRVVVGSTLATFGPGGEVLSIQLPSDCSAITIVNLPPDTVKGEIIALLSPLDTDVPVTPESIQITSVGVTSWARVGFSNPQIPERAVHLINGAHYKDHVLQVHLVKAKTASGALQDATRVHVSWFSPSRIAWAHFRRLSDASAAVSSLHKTCVDGREIQCELVNSKPPVGKSRIPRIYSVSLSGLAASTSRSMLEVMTRSAEIEMGDPTYDLSDIEAIQHVRNLLSEHGKLESFDVKPSSATRKVKARARFESGEGARKAVTTLANQKQSALGDTMLHASLVYLVKFVILGDMYDAISDYITQLQQQESDLGLVKLNIYGPDHIKRMTLRIYGEDGKLVASVKRKVEAILAGEVMKTRDGGGFLWHPFLASPSGLEVLKELNNKFGVFFYRDLRKQKISLLGAPTDRELAETQLRIEIVRLLDEKRVYPLNPDQFQYAILRGEAEVKSLFGPDAVTLWVNGATKRAQFIDGNFDPVEAYKLLIGVEERKVSRVNSSDPDDCSVCFCPPTDLYETECAHNYCQACIRNYIETSISDRKFPILCLGLEGKCKAPFSLQQIRKIIPAERLEALFTASFSQYVSSLSDTYHYCPTPDCLQIFRISTDGTVETCSECLVDICTTCQVGNHQGLTCQQYQDPDDKLFKEYVEEGGLKPCPNCKMYIEKSFGCNHLMCTSCQTHICWFCMETFKAGTMVYAHMENEHGKIYDD